MPHIAKATVYAFDELPDHAKETARDWWRQGALDYDWYDSIFEDAETVGRLIGIDTENIYFSGFSCQGDGACFTGSYRYESGGLAALKHYAPLDDTLHRIAADLQTVQRAAFYKLGATIRHCGHYSHEFCTEIQVEHECRPATVDEQDGVSEFLRRFMRWIYQQLEQEYKYLMSDEHVDDAIRANCYEFTESGDIYY